MPDEPRDPLDDLRDRIRATEEAAARVAAEAAGARREWSEGRIPPAGWATPGEHGQRTDEVQALVALLQSLRELVPEDLADQIRDLVRQLLLVLRALIDWWVERMETGPRAPQARPGGPVAEDIPVS
jgi:hypothetical protein